jgi:gamma-glutamyltranspeptidase/glutathione hydrolase
MVISGSVISTQVGREILGKGGNAVDAIVAASAVLGLTEPSFSGPLGVGYLLFYSPRIGKVQALEFGGRGPARLRPELFADEKERSVGPKSIAVPGNIAGWVMLLKKYGTMSTAEVFAPAINLAEKGFPLTDSLANSINRLLTKPWPTTIAAYSKKDKTPWQGGDIFTNPAYGRTLRVVATKGLGVIYGGRIGAAIVKTVQELGGFLTIEDLRTYKPEWMTPLSTTFRGYTIYTTPPPSTGIQVLETLNILEGYDLKSMGHDSSKYLHLFMEAVNLAATDRDKYVGDPDFVQVPVQMLLAKDNAAKRRSLIDVNKALTTYPESKQEGTTHLVVADRWGNIVAISHTLAGLWGSQIVGGDSGFILNNAYEYANAKPGHPDCIGPRRRQAWCLSPCMIFDEGGRFWASVGSPGGETIQQTQAQVIVNLIEFGMDPQEAVSAPRFAHSWMGQAESLFPQFGVLETSIDAGLDQKIYDELTAMAHKLKVPKTGYGYTGSNAVIRFNRKAGWYLGGADPRRNLYAIGY